MQHREFLDGLKAAVKAHCESVGVELKEWDDETNYLNVNDFRFDINLVAELPE